MLIYSFFFFIIIILTIKRISKKINNRKGQLFFYMEFSPLFIYSKIFIQN